MKLKTISSRILIILFSVLLISSCNKQNGEEIFSQDYLKAYNQQDKVLMTSLYCIEKDIDKSLDQKVESIIGREIDPERRKRSIIREAIPVEIPAKYTDHFKEVLDFNGIIVHWSVKPERLIKLTNEYTDYGVAVIKKESNIDVKRLEESFITIGKRSGNNDYCIATHTIVTKAGGSS